MGKTKDSLVISVDKYNMFSLFIPIAYGIQFLYNKTKDYPLIKFISPLLHTYHLGRSIYDRFSFHSKCDNTSHFINHDFTKNDAHYILTGIDHNYGLSITEMASVTGLVSNILDYFSTVNGLTDLKFPSNKCDLTQYLTTDKLTTCSNYALVTTMTLTFLNMLIGSSSASIKINYDVFTEDQEVEFYQNEIEVINYTLEN